jgi:hypothetical protein
MPSGQSLYKPRIGCFAEPDNSRTALPAGGLPAPGLRKKRTGLSPSGPRGIRRPASRLGFGPTTSRHIAHDRLHRRRAQLRAIPKHPDHCVEGQVRFEPKARIPAGQRNQLTVGAPASARRRPQLPFCKIQLRPFGPTALRQAYSSERLKTRGLSKAATFKPRRCRIGGAVKVGTVAPASGSSVRRSATR